MNKTNGKIAEGSKRAIAAALLKIMEQYDYREITVTQIAQEAELSRKTFYRLFGDKEQVLGYSLNETIGEFFSRLTELKGGYWELVQLYFNFWQERAELLRLFKKNDLLFLIYEYSYKNALRVFELVRSADTAEGFSETLPYMLAYSVGGMSSMLLKWAQEDMKTPSRIFIAQLKAGFSSANI